MGAPIITGTGQGHAKNSRLTDGDVVHHSRNVTYGAMKPHLKEPDPVHAGSDKHSKQHNIARSNDRKGGTTAVAPTRTRPQHMEDSSKRTSGGHGVLDRVHMKGRS